MGRVLVWLLLTPVFVALAVIGIRQARAPDHPPPAAARPVASASPYAADVLPEPREAPPPTPGVTARCEEGPADAAAANRESLATAQWSAFGRSETGWETYAPLAAAEAGAAACDGASPGFAAALALWQQSHRLPRTGVMDEPTLRAMAIAWALKRPFVQVNRTGVCPPPPADTALETALPAEVYGGRPIRLRRAALAALRQMTAAARAEVPELAADRNLLTIMSGFRDPTEEAARCGDGGCDNVSRSSCSAHRTGLAADLYLGAAPGSRPDSSDDVNRLWQTRTPAYRWLVANAARFGFVNYAFEPWHWEWTGEPVLTPGGA